MLVLRRKKLQSIQLGEATITVLAVKGDAVTLGINAPNELRIMRTEILEDQERYDRHFVDFHMGGSNVK